MTETHDEQSSESRRTVLRTLGASLETAALAAAAGLSAAVGSEDQEGGRLLASEPRRPAIPPGTDH